MHGADPEVALLRANARLSLSPDMKLSTAVAWLLLFRRANKGTLSLDTEGLMRASGFATPGPFEGGASLRLETGGESPEHRVACV